MAFILIAFPLMMFGTLPDIINNSVLSFPLKVLAQENETSPNFNGQKIVRQGRLCICGAELNDEGKCPGCLKDLNLCNCGQAEDAADVEDWLERGVKKDTG